MFEEITCRPCILAWFGMSHILFQNSGFIPVAMVEGYPCLLDTCYTYDQAYTSLVTYLDLIYMDNGGFEFSLTIDHGEF